MNTTTKAPVLPPLEEILREAALIGQDAVSVRVECAHTTWRILALRDRSVSSHEHRAPKYQSLSFVREDKPSQAK